MAKLSQAITIDVERFKELWPTYIVDWLLCLVFLVGSLCLEFVMPFRRHFSVKDKEISFPYKEEETITSVQVGLIAYGIPLVAILIINLTTRSRMFDLHQGILGLGLAITLATLITQVAKITIGRPRPDFLSRCKPTETDDPPFSLSTVDICTWTDRRIMNDGMRSFLSGHTSSAFAGLGFLTFYMAGKMHVFDKRGFVFKPLFCILPLIGAALVGISRIDDYRHHWQDVFAGASVGLVMAYFSYRQYYPSLASPLAHRPFSPRIPRARISMDAVSEKSEEETEQAPEVVVEEPSQR